MLGARLVFTSRSVMTAHPGFMLRNHSHYCSWQADWVLSGELQYVIAGKTTVLKARQIFLIPPRIAHQMYSAAGFTLLSIKFTLLHDIQIYEPTVIDLNGEGSLLHLLAAEVFSPRLALPWEMDCKYLGALLRLIAPASSRESAGVKGDDPIERAKEYALLHMEEKITTKLLANVAHLSVTQFYRRFVSATGVPPLRWVTEQKLRRANELLLYADRSISNIALELGYTDLPSFSKAYKRWFGLSPQAYRQQNGYIM